MSMYSDLLQHPRWQKKRLEVLEAAEFRCEECGASDKTLHVHHIYYAKGKKPWEYHAAFLRCLCRDCHATAEAYREAVSIAIGLMPGRKIVQTIGYTRGLLLAEGTFSDIFVDGDDELIGVADAVRLNAATVKSLLDESGFLHRSAVLEYMNRGET